MIDMNINELATRISDHLSKLETPGFVVWSNQCFTDKYLFPTKVGEAGCTDQTCAHNSHDPLGDDVRYTPINPDHQLFCVGYESNSDYWVLSHETNLIASYCVDYDGAYHDHTRLITVNEIPDYVLASWYRNI